MPYSDLINLSDAYFRVSFNNSKTPEKTGLFTNNTVGSGTLTTGHPFDATLKSVTFQETAGIAKETYEIPNASSTNYLNYPAGVPTATVFEGWVKYTLGASNTVANWEVVRIYEFNSTYGDTDSYIVRINPGTYTGTGTAGTLSVQCRDANGVNFINSTDFLIPNQWNLIHIDSFSDKRTDIYINGKYSNSTGGVTYRSNNTIRFQIGGCWAIQGTANDSTLQIAEVVSYNRKLTHDEKYLRYKYGQSVAGFNTIQLTDGALCQMRYDNPNKSTAMTLYGSAASTFGNTFADVGSTKTGITAYQTGKKDYQWNIINGHASSQQIWQGSQTFATALQNVMQNGSSYSFEWVEYVPATYNANFRIFEFGSNSTSPVNKVAGGYILTNQSTTLTGKGQPTVSVGYRSTTTGSWQTGSLSGIPNPSTNTTNRNYLKLDEGNWYHFVLTVDRSTTSLSVVLYVNGVGMKSRTFGSGTYASNSANDTTVTFTPTEAAFGPNGVTADATWGFDNFAIYQKVLSQTEIDNHYFALLKAEKAVKYFNGTTWVNAQAQKVWNGTTWVDWSAQYYDGTQWVTF
jgi:hypothetical protein